MNAKEKANELIEKFMLYSFVKTEISKETMQYEYNYKIKRELAKQCAIIAVDEIIDQWDYVDTYLANLGGEFNPNLRYWQEVKTELEKL